MTLIEAIKSGRPFRRTAWKTSPDNAESLPKGHGGWIKNEWPDGTYRDCSISWVPERWHHTVGISYVDVLADDWEIQEPEPVVTIARTEFWEIAKDLLNATARDHQPSCDWLRRFARKLGLGDAP